MSGRPRRLEELVAGRELDALLVTHIVNVGWLTGFTGSTALAVVGGDLRTFLTDFRYVEQAEAEVADFDRRRTPPELLAAVRDVLPDARPLRLGFEDQHLAVRSHERLRELLDEDVELVPAGGLVEDLRGVKEPEELARIEAAAQLADQALRETVLERGLAGRSEREVAATLEARMRELGASEPSFPSIVAFGAHGARPHAEPRDVEIPAGEIVVIDWGARLDGYCSDCTRTLATGEPGEDPRAVYEVVREAQAAGLGAVAPGIGGREVDALARRVIDAAGHGELYGHGLGHGVGVEVHEAPRLSLTSEATLCEGNVVTVEPGIYVPGRFGVRIEDLVAVTADGGRVLNGLPKELTVVG